MDRFAGKTVLVTGATTGIGEGCARRFAAEGANVVLAARTRDTLKALAAGLAPGRTLACPTDVSDPAAVARTVEAAVERFGGLDVLVSNAGVYLDKPFADTSLEEWRQVMSVDLDGPFHCAKAALPHLKKSRGSIVHIASVSGLGGDWQASAYATAKGAVANFTRSLALELGREGVRVNAVAPTLTDTRMTAAVLADPALLARFTDRIALGRAGEPDDIAGPVAFLASEDARFVTGVVLPVDGGLSASNGQPRLG